MAEEFPRIERLEVRRLFVVGTAGNDVIDIQSVGGDSRNFYRAVVNGVASEDVMLTGQREIGVDGLGGNDLITISTSLLAYAFVTGSQCLKCGLATYGAGRSSRNSRRGTPAATTR